MVCVAVNCICLVQRRCWLALKKVTVGRAEMDRTMVVEVVTVGKGLVTTLLVADCRAEGI